MKKHFSLIFSILFLILSLGFVSSLDVSKDVSSTQIIVGEQVRWLEKVNSVDGKIEVPKYAENINLINKDNVEKIKEEISSVKYSPEDKRGFVKISVLKIKGKINFYSDLFDFIKKEFFMKNKVDYVVIDSSDVKEIKVDDASEELYVEYYTPAPEVEEVVLENGKNIKISASDELGYENVLAFTYLKDEVRRGAVSVMHVETGKKVNIAEYDLNGNELIDYVEWVVPHLSEQNYELRIEVLNPLEYLRDGDTWTVYFDTLGTGDLNIYSTNANFEEITEDDLNTNDEMEFLNLKCGSRNLENDLYIISNGEKIKYLDVEGSVKIDSFLIENYSCSRTGEFSAFMNIGGYAILNFTFSDESRTVSDLAVDPISGVVLSSTSGNNLTTDNLTISISGNDAYNITDWRLNGTSLAVLNMPMDLNNATGVRDYSTKGNNGTIINGVTWTASGKVGGAYNFDGTTDSINITDSEDWNFGTGNFTIAFWYKPSGSPVAYDTWIGQDATTNDIWAWDMGASGTYPRLVGVSGGATKVEVSTTAAQTFTAGTWYHMSVVRNGTSIVMYKNGVSVPLTVSTAISTNAMPSVSAPLVIGLRPTQSGRDINGTLDELMIIKGRAFSKEQINALYLDGVANKSMTTLVSQEISKNNNYTVMVTPNNGTTEGTSVLSNWLKVGPTRIQLTDPTTDNPNIVSDAENISILFRMLDDGTNVTSGVTLNNITIGGIKANLLGMIATLNTSSRTCAQTWGTSCAGHTSYTMDSCSGGSYGNGFAVTSVTINTTEAAIGDKVRVTCVFDTFDGYTWDDLAFSYHNGGSWTQLWAGRNGDTSGSYTKYVDFTVGGSLGTQYVRCSNSFFVDGDTGTCFTGGYADNDDANFTVVVGTTQAFTYLNNTGWQANVTVPSGLSGYQDLYINTSYGGSIVEATEDNAITYSIIVIDSSRISPTNATTTDDLKGYCQGTDVLDASNVTYYYKWYKNGVSYSTGVTSNYSSGVELNVNNISNALTSSNETWILSCLATDGADNSTWLNSSSVSIPILLDLSNVILNSTSGNNYTIDNLSIYYTKDSNAGVVKDWRNNGTSLAVLNMPMDLNNATKSKDYSTNGNNGTVNGSTWTSSGKVGGAYSFDGVNDYINLGDVLDFGTNNYSVGFWFKVPNTSGNQMLISKSNGDYPDWDAYIMTDGTVDVRLTIDASNGRSTRSSAGLDNNVWHYLMFTANRNTGVLKVYVDGVDDSHIYAPTSIGVITGNANNAANLMIGARNITASPLYLNGSIDEVQIFNKTLSSEQINSIYLDGVANKSMEKLVSQEISVGNNYTVMLTPNNGTTEGTSVLSNSLTIVDDTSAPLVSFVNPTFANLNSTTNNWLEVNVSSSDVGRGDGNVSNVINFNNSLISWWRMDDINGSGSPTDYMGRNNGTKFGDAAQTTSGKIGKAFNFDGTGDYISIPDSTSWDFAGDFAINFWVNFKSYINYQNVLSTTTDGNAIGGFWIEFGSSRGFTLYNNGSLLLEDNVLSMTALQTNVWQNVVIVRSGTGANNLKIYINGTLYGQASSNATINGGANPLLIGRYHTTSTTNYLNGSVDDVMIFNRSLSATEIQGLYSNTTSKYTYVNYSSLALGNYSVKAYAQDTKGNLNFTESRTFTVAGAPIINSVRISPTSPTPSDNLVGYCNGTSWDASNVTYYYKWYKNGGLNISGQSSSFSSNIEKNVNNISSGLTSSGQIWILSCLVNNAGLNSSWMNSSSVTVYDAELQITDPTTSNPETVVAGENITILFNFLSGGNNLTNGVTVNNVTIGGTFATITGSGYVSGQGWQVNVTAPSGFTGYKNLFVNATNSSTVSDTESNAIFYEVVTINSVRINPTPAANDSQDLKGYCNGTNLAGGSNITYYYQWYKNGGVNSSGQTGTSFSNIEKNVNNLSNSLTSLGENWILSCLASNSTYNSSWMNSSITFIGNLRCWGTPETISGTIYGYYGGWVSLGTYNGTTTSGGGYYSTAGDLYTLSGGVVYKNGVALVAGTGWSDLTSYTNPTDESGHPLTAVAGDSYCWCHGGQGEYGSSYTNVGTQDMCLYMDGCVCGLYPYSYSLKLTSLTCGTPTTYYYSSLTMTPVIVMNTTRIDPENESISNLDLRGYCKGTDSGDASNLSYCYTWYVNNVTRYVGESSASASGVESNINDIANSLTTSGENWKLSCAASDGSSSSSWMNSSTTTITPSNCSLLSGDLFVVKNSNNRDCFQVDTSGNAVFWGDYLEQCSDSPPEDAWSIKQGVSTNKFWVNDFCDVCIAGNVTASSSITYEGTDGMYIQNNAGDYLMKLSSDGSLNFSGEVCYEGEECISSGCGGDTCCANSQCNSGSCVGGYCTNPTCAGQSDYIGLTSTSYTGSSIGSVATANAACVSKFGAGYTWLEFHQDIGWYASASLAPGSATSGTGWTWIDDQTAECYQTGVNGMTWGLEYDSCTGCVYASCAATSCDAYDGETSCAESRTIMCVK